MRPSGPTGRVFPFGRDPPKYRKSHRKRRTVAKSYIKVHQNHNRDDFGGQHTNLHNHCSDLGAPGCPNVVQRSPGEGVMQQDASVRQPRSTQPEGKITRFCRARGQVVSMPRFSPLDSTLPNTEKVIENVELSPNPISKLIKIRTGTLLRVNIQSA